MNLRFLGSTYRKSLTKLIENSRFKLTDYLNLVVVSKGDVDSLPSGFISPLMITDTSNPDFGKRKFVLGVDDVD